MPGGRPVSAGRVAKVEPQAALGLVGLVAGQLRRLIDETQPDQPYLVYLLRGGLEEISEQAAPLDGFQVGLLRESVWRGRRLDMATAFNRLNPTFGVPVAGWCWPESTVPADAPARPGVPNLADAKASVRAVVAAFNATAGPVLARLEGGARR